MILCIAFNVLGRFFKSKPPPNKNTGGLEPEGARPDVHRSDEVMWKFKQIQPPVGRLIENIHYYKHAGVLGSKSKFFLPDLSG